MEAGSKTVDWLSPTLNVNLPGELLVQLDFKENRDQPELTVWLKDGKRQLIQFGQLGSVLSGQRQVGFVGYSSKFALGNLLVAGGQINQLQLEDALLRQNESGRRLGEELITAGHASKVQVDNGLLMQHKLISCLLAVAVGLAPIISLVPSAEAGQSMTAMPVSVTVIANTKMFMHYQTAYVRVSRADISRGYVDVISALRFSVATNSRAGYLMEFHSGGSFFESIEIHWLGGVAHLSADGGSVVQRGVPPRNQINELSFRFTLRADALPGNYPWPLSLAVRPLA